MTQAEILSLTTIVGMALGWVLKNKSGWKDTIDVKLIPAILFVLSVLKSIAVAAGILPPEAGVISGSASLMGADHETVVQLAGWGSPFWWLVNVVVDGAVPVGLHSTVKNFVQWVKGKLGGDKPAQPVQPV